MAVGFSPVGKCIYCGSTKPPLHKEHIVPFALEGTGTLPQASCTACEKATCDLEGYVLGHLLGPFRHAANFRSRKRGRKPEERELTFWENPDSDETRSVPLDRSEYPIALHLPVFPLARILRGLEPDNHGETIDGGFWSWVDKERVAKLLSERGIGTFSTGKADPYAWARLMAKIAHCCTVAEVGIEGFTPLTVDLIIGEKQPMNYWVGCGGFENPPNPDNVLHTSGRIDHPSGMIIQVIQLFAWIDAPAYHVVCGLRPGGEIAKIF